MSGSGLIRKATPLVLLALAGLAWFGPYLPGHAAIVRNFGANGILQFVLGLACVFLAITVLEQRRVEALFKHVVDEFKKFHQGRDAGAGQTDPVTREQAVGILLAALESDDRTVRASAVENLIRISGQRLGDDPKAWRQWFAREFGKK